MAEEPAHIRVTYNEVHDLIKAASAKIAVWKPDMMIAIGCPALFSVEALTYYKFQHRRRVSISSRACITI
jgi:hypothetical protein